MELRQISIPIGSIDNLEIHRGVLGESTQNLVETNVPPAQGNEQPTTVGNNIEKIRNEKKNCSNQRYKLLI